jgi:hypothetical protein
MLNMEQPKHQACPLQQISWELYGNGCIWSWSIPVKSSYQWVLENIFSFSPLLLK